MASRTELASKQIGGIAICRTLRPQPAQVIRILCALGCQNLVSLEGEGFEQQTVRYVCKEDFQLDHFAQPAPHMNPSMKTQPAPTQSSQVVPLVSQASQPELLDQGLLGPVEPAELLQASVNSVQAPGWLRILNLQQSRTNIRCLRWRTRAAKRGLDILVASSLLVITAPLVALAALTIKLSSPGPIFFSQIRVGLNQRKQHEPTDCEHAVDPEQCRRDQAAYGKPFRIFKLRTMHAASDANGPTQAKSGDSRVFPAGKLFRRMRIDELPQLLNVLRGEMSMVGPRPECIEYMEELNAKVPNYAQRLGLKPGLTGIAQIEAGYANDLDSYRRKVGYDLLYLQNCCISNDLRIMLGTLKVVFTGFGAL